MPFKLQARPQRTLGLQGLHVAMATQNCSILSESRVHTLGYSSCIPPHKLSPINHSYIAIFPILAWHQNLFFFSSHSRYQSTSSAPDLQSDYCTLPYIHPNIHSYHIPFSLLAWHPNTFFLSSPSQYQSTSSVAYPLSDYQHTLLHRPF